MSLSLILALQAATPAAPAALAAIDFDLARLPPAGFEPWSTGRRCAGGDPEAITVCGRRTGGAYPLDEMARIFEPRPLRAEMNVADNMIADAHVEAGPMDRGAVSNRAMVRLRLGF
jgi:hypothetical protein